jgi:hypothetical protein
VPKVETITLSTVQAAALGLYDPRHFGPQLPTIPDREIGRHARKAAQVMNDRGKATGAFVDSDGQVCAMGAFDIATRPMGKTNFRRGLLIQMFNMRFAEWMREHYPLDEKAPLIGGWTPTWNDSILESKEETVAWMHKFADDLDPQK